MSKRKRITWDYEMVKNFVEIESGSGVKLLSESFENTRSILKFKCPCGNVFERRFTKFYHREQRICSDCSWKSLGDKRRKSHEQFVKEIYEIHGDEYTVLGNYVRLKDKILVRHNSPACNYREYEVEADSFLHGRRGCIECHYQSRVGSGNPTWNPDLSDEEREQNRDYYEYIEWRRLVYERDDYTCQCCKRHGLRLNAHHILNFSKYKELRTELDNGITLCEECHRGFHREYGYSDNNGVQLREFLGRYKKVKESA